MLLPDVSYVKNRRRVAYPPDHGPMRCFYAVESRPEMIKIAPRMVCGRGRQDLGSDGRKIVVDEHFSKALHIPKRADRRPESMN